MAWLAAGLAELTGLRPIGVGAGVACGVAGFDALGVGDGVGVRVGVPTLVVAPADAVAGEPLSAVIADCAVTDVDPPSVLTTVDPGRVGRCDG